MFHQARTSAYRWIELDLQVAPTFFELRITTQLSQLSSVANPPEVRSCTGDISCPDEPEAPALVPSLGLAGGLHGTSPQDGQSWHRLRTGIKGIPTIACCSRWNIWALLLCESQIGLDQTPAGLHHSQPTRNDSLRDACGKASHCILLLESVQRGIRRWFA